MINETDVVVVVPCDQQIVVVDFIFKVIGVSQLAHEVDKFDQYGD